MAKSQSEDRFTQIPNEELEKLATMHLTSNQWQVIQCIIRKTYGFHKKVDWIANFQIGEATGLGKTVVSRCLKELSNIQLITRRGKYIGIQKDWKRWGKLAEQLTLLDNKSKQDSQPKLAISSPKLAEQLTKVSSSEDTQKKKETITKQTIQKKPPFVLPEWIDKKTWEAFLEMREKKKAVQTEYALSLIIKALERFKAAGDDPNEILKKSIMNSWKGVFPLDKKGGQGGAHQQGSRGLPTHLRSPDQIFQEGE